MLLHYEIGGRIMPFSIVPNAVFEAYGDITPEYLARRGITLLLSDLD